MRVVALLIFFLFLFTGDVFATLSLSLDAVPGEIDADQEFIGNVSLSCTNCSDSYLRGAFFSSGATDYFGYTRNDSGDWVNASNPKTIYFHILPVESSWSGQLRFRFDKEKAPGNYQFKVMRYTGSGSKSGETDSFPVNVIAPATPTPTATIIVTPTSTPTSTSASSAITKTTTPSAPSPTTTKTPTPQPTSTPTPSKIPTPTVQATNIRRSDLLTLTPTATLSGLVLASSQSADPSISAVLSAENQSLAVDEPEPDNVANFAFVGVLVATFGLLALIYRRLKLLAIKKERIK